MMVIGKVLSALYVLGAGWCMVAAMVAHQRTGWPVWYIWLRGLAVGFGLGVMGLVVLFHPGVTTPLWFKLSILWGTALPQLVMLALVWGGWVWLPGFARIRDWLRLAQPDPSLQFREQAEARPDQLWVPPAQLSMRRPPLGVPWSFWLLIVLAVVALVYQGLQ